MVAPQRRLCLLLARFRSTHHLVGHHLNARVALLRSTPKRYEGSPNGAVSSDDHALLLKELLHMEADAAFFSCAKVAYRKLRPC